MLPRKTKNEVKTMKELIWFLEYNYIEYLIEAQNEIGRKLLKNTFRTFGNKET